MKFINPQEILNVQVTNPRKISQMQPHQAKVAGSKWQHVLVSGESQGDSESTVQQQTDLCAHSHLSKVIQSVPVDGQA